MKLADDEYLEVVAGVHVEGWPVYVCCGHRHSWLPAALACQSVYVAQAEFAFVQKFKGEEWATMTAQERAETQTQFRGPLWSEARKVRT